MLNLMYNNLSKHPIIGYISGLLGAVCYQIHSFLTDEALLKLVSSVGVWAGAAVAVLSAIVYLFKVARLFRGVYQRWRNPPLASLIIAGTTALLLSGCGARKVELRTSRSSLKLDSSYSSTTATGSEYRRDSAADVVSSHSGISLQSRFTIDTGKKVSTNKTVITAQFAPGTGPTAADIVANGTLPGTLLNRATSLSFSSDQTIAEQRYLQTMFEIFRKETDEQIAKARLLAMGRDSSNTEAKGQVEKETEDLTKEKDSQREAWPGTTWIWIIGAVLFGVLLVYYFFFRER